jgi:signal transduction histidine kinase
MRYLASPDLPSPQLLAMAIHDLRTPVTAIKGFSQLALRRRDLPADLRQHLDTIVAEANRAAGYLEDLSILCQIDTGEMIVEASPTDLRSILNRTAGQLNRGFLAASVVVEGDDSLVARCDPFLTARATSHLVRVSLKHAGDSPVRVAVVRVSGHPALVVAARSDVTRGLDTYASTGHNQNGAGVGGFWAPGSPEDADQEEVDPGTRGLGLYIATKLIEAQGGAVWVDQPTGGGVRFFAVLSDGQDLSLGSFSIGRPRPPTPDDSEGGPQQWS